MGDMRRDEIDEESVKFGKKHVMAARAQASAADPGKEWAPHVGRCSSVSCSLPQLRDCIQEGRGRGEGLFGTRQTNPVTSTRHC